MKIRNSLLKLSLTVLLTSASTLTHAAIGNVDGITALPSKVLNGYACGGGGNPDVVAAYAGGPAGTGTLVASGYANNPGFTASDNSAINTTCGTSGAGKFYRFNIPLKKPALSYAGVNRALYVYDANDGTLLSAGAFTLPAQPAYPAGTGAPFYPIITMLNNGQNTVQVKFVGDSHTTSYGVTTPNTWLYALAAKFAAAYPAYKVSLMQRDYYWDGTQYNAGATNAGGTSMCADSNVQDLGTPQWNTSAMKTLNIIVDGIGGSNLERYMERLSTTAPSGTPFPAYQSVTKSPYGGVDAVIMMFGVNDWMERYTNNGAYGCYSTSVTLGPGGSYGTADLQIHGTNGHLGFEHTDPTAQFETAYETAITGTINAEYAASGNTITPFIGLMTPMNPPGLLETNCLPSSCTFMPYNKQISSTTPDWTYSMQSIQDGTYTAANVSLGTMATVFDLYSWIVLTPSVLIEDAANANWDIHLNATGNSDLATIVWNQGFGLP